MLGERLAAEPERGEPVQLVERADLARGMTLERELELSGRDALPVVRDLEHVIERALHPDLDRARRGIERVLHDFLERRQRPLDHLARGDARSGFGRKPANRAGHLGDWPPGRRRSIT